MTASRDCAISGRERRVASRIVVRRIRGVYPAFGGLRPVHRSYAREKLGHGAAYDPRRCRISPSRNSVFAILSSTSSPALATKRRRENREDRENRKRQRLNA